VELKDYQRRVLERFDTYLKTLHAERHKAEAAIQALLAAGLELPDGMADWPKAAWKKIETLLPRVKTPAGAIIPAHMPRHDARDRSIPHVCLKVPTGGGKTLLAAECVGRLQTDFFKRQTGLVLWVVPTVQIYTQTRKALFNRLHPYRQTLERASGGRVKVLEKDDPLTKAHVENYLCIMLVQLAATGNANNNQFYRIFKDAGRYASFFPETDDLLANKALLEIYKDLEINDLGDVGDAMGVSIKQSLVNVLKMQRPVVVIDEGQKAYSEIRRNSLNGFNPSFILELTATPNIKKHVSNVLVDVSGVDLKDEQMIKLPINIVNTRNGDWKNTLTMAHGRLAELAEKSVMLQTQDGRYIRPIMVIRVERIGNDQRDGQKIHALDVREYLTERLSVRDDEIRIKSSEKDELGDTDLFDPLCPVRYIITKQALQEGWDCSFAYVLTLLDVTTAQTAMTQMIGRVLRQPDARSTSIDALNECYVYCYNQEVKEAVENIKKGLQEEGMDGLGEFVRAETGQAGPAPDSVEVQKIKRKQQFTGLKIFLPKVLHRQGNHWRDISYERDILAHLPWDTLTYDASGTLDARNAPSVTEVAIDVANREDLTGEPAELELVTRTQQQDVWVEKKLDIGFLTRPLLDIVPNPWQASRIWLHAIDTLRQAGRDDDFIYNNRLYILENMKRSLKEQVHKLSEELFQRKLKQGEITFKLLTNGNEHLNYQLAHELQVLAARGDRKLIENNSLFEFLYEKDFNSLEKDFALYLSAQEAVQWWHRMVARQDYGLQGWQRNKVYPDFIACLNNNRVLVLETKGLQLKGNDDTEYKTALFGLLSGYQAAIRAGTVELSDPASANVSLHMLMQDAWEEEATSLLHIAA